jgi:tetratricopeptide (TPR) repeat protein
MHSDTSEAASSPAMPSAPDWADESEDLSDEAIVRHLREGLADNLPELLEEAQAAMREGLTLGELRGLTPEHYESLYRLACELRDSGNVEDTLPVAVQLALHQPQDNRVLLMAAQCLYDLNMHKSALGMYCMSLKNDPTPAALCQMGNCFLALGHDEHAIQAFDAALECGDGSEQNQEVQEYCARTVRLLCRKISGVS